jgi:acyl transferase domain-containing protein/NAD(P)H-dependent flavin oxidoreductase YrpB (nitropropane dioxygenase family)/NADP-dependent 3-hydroxy acid dehydrogenase YdfG
VIPKPPGDAPGPSARSIPRVVALTPFERPDPGLVAALSRAGALGVLDLGRDPSLARAALHEAARACPRGFGVRVPDGAELDLGALPGAVRAVVLGAPDVAPGLAEEVDRPFAVLVQVTSIDEAREALARGADGLVVKGSESGGRVRDETALVLLQRVLRETRRPLWVQGGVGEHTAAACLAGGARGVVLDAQLALLPEASLPEATRAAIASMDGSETAVIGGYRVLARPDLPAARRAGVTAAEVRERLGADAALGLVPAGQDAALARPLAERFRTAAGLVHGLSAAIAAHLGAARRARPLAPGAALAADHGVTFPIAQGPMTRVSDRASFAEAVARAGALPFLALSLFRGPEVRALLEETRARLGGRPLGVGILGFVPEELRDEQLAVLRDVRPDVAIIAGGRPSLARPLEALGIATYLHVPSPGLLELFLAEGARRFVFEGRECGGHVGPRTSLVLWELAVSRLTAFLEREGPEVARSLSILFAGGVHDDVSAAMVAALAGPLAACGARVGALMGTAYLFTEEAVATGAIERGFQSEAIACESTVLLETAPGHATRCADTGYARAFHDEKARLERAGESAEAIWAALEQKNLGRLRVAAKGLERRGDALVRVGDDEQRREGMYMIGQVAALRSAPLSIEALHREVSEGGTARVEALAPVEAELLPPARRVEPPAVDVAIVGMACVFPGAPDLDAYWANVVLGRSAITEVPRERFDVGLYYEAEGGPGKTRSKWGGFLPDVPFDPLVYGIPPRSLAAIEPSQLLGLEVAARALADAGYATRPFDRERASVIFGAEGGTDLPTAYGFRAVFPQYGGPLPAALDAALPVVTEDSFPGVLANVIAGRVANRLDLGGVNYTVDAACASSLAAVELAVKELATGTSDLVLCGGVDLHNAAHDYLMFSSVHALSPTGESRTFDATADGIVLGEGVACVALKRLDDAERDGDRVYAVIKAVAGSSDGKSLGLTAPRKEGQVRALERAYGRARVSPAEVGLVEAHGTGTVVGDRTELATLTEVFTAARAEPGACGLGSVKSQIGHTKCAAGLAGLIKAALAIHHRVLPPTLHVTKPNPAYDPATSPFALSGVARPWVSERRVAGVSAFGFGGTNFHGVLEGAPSAPGAGLREWPVELFLVRGASREAALGACERLARLARSGQPYRLRDLALSACAGHGRVWASVVAEGLADLADKLGAVKSILENRRGAPPDGVSVRDLDDAPPGGVALLFPGQGSQRPHMLRELFVAFPRLARRLALAPRVAARWFPAMAATPADRRAQAEALTDTRVAQPALGLAGMAVAELLASMGVMPDMAGGHSYGELVALCAAGALGEPDLVRLSEARAACLLEAAGDDPGAMAALPLAASEAERAIAGSEGVVLANLNAPDQTIVAGPSASIERLLAGLEAEGVAARRLPVACAFHSPIVAEARHALARALEGVAVRAPRFPVWSNTTAEPYPADPEAIRARVAEHVARPVRFAEQLERMYDAGARVFVEAGPGRVLTQLVSRVLGARPHRTVACDQSTGSGLAHLLAAAGELATLGLSVDARPLFAHRDAARLDLERPPRIGPSPSAYRVNGHLVRTPSGDVPEGGLRPVTEPVLAAGAAPSGGDEGAVLEYLRSMRELARAQRDVMLRYLGAAPAAAEGGALVEATLEPAPRPAPIVVTTQAEAPRGSTETVADTLLRIVSDRTGYPIEMLDLDLNLEADLSIDSIKRIEILGVLRGRLALSEGDPGARGVIEQLARIKTLRGILDWIETNGQNGQNGGAPALPAAPVDTARSPSLTAPARGEPRLVRSVVRDEPAPLHATSDASFAGRSFAITRDGGELAEALAAHLTARGATTRVAAPSASLGDGATDVVHLAPLAVAPGPSLPDAAACRDAALSALEAVRAASRAGARSVLLASWAAPFASLDGLAGLARSAARELPALAVRAVGLDRRAAPTVLVAELAAELAGPREPRVARWIAGERRAPSVRREELPPGDGEIDLGPESVVLVTGGARGITARVAAALAERFGCRLELVGRTPRPEAREPDDLAAAETPQAIRRALLARGDLGGPPAIEAACGKILAAREIRATLAAIERAGGSVGYHALDVRDGAALRGLVEDLHARHGRLDAVIHGAGLIEDRRIEDKTPESFARVFDTKVASALALADALPPSARYVVLFGSVAGVLGNAGQSDYAAANDALDALAARLAGKESGRVVSIDWGPWAGAGMVSLELAREYERRGVGLIPVGRGVAALLDELARGGAEAQVVLAMGDERVAAEPRADRPPAIGELASGTA